MLVYKSRNLCPKILSEVGESTNTRTFVQRGLSEWYEPFVRSTSCHMTDRSHDAHPRMTANEMRENGVGCCWSQKCIYVCFLMKYSLRPLIFNWNHDKQHFKRLFFRRIIGFKLYFSLADRKWSASYSQCRNFARQCANYRSCALYSFEKIVSLQVRTLKNFPLIILVKKGGRLIHGVDFSTSIYGNRRFFLNLRQICDFDTSMIGGAT